MKEFRSSEGAIHPLDCAVSRPIMNRAFSALDRWGARDPGLRPGLKMSQAFGLNAPCPGRTNIPRTYLLLMAVLVPAPKARFIFSLGHRPRTQP
jgi:hypothetical protein